MTTRQTFGQELRRQRERRGITLDAIANATKIGKSLLAGLERGDCSRWPGGIYSRAYVKDYARAIGLNADEVAARFIACHEASASNASSGRGVHPPPDADTRLRLTLAESGADAGDLVVRTRLFAIDVLIVLGGAAAINAVAHVDIWMAAAGMGVGCHALGILRGGIPTASILASWLRGSTSRASNESHSEPVVARPV